HLPEVAAEIQAQRQLPVPTFGIEEIEQLSEAALRVVPAAGLSAQTEERAATEHKLSERELQQLAQLAHAVEGLHTRAEILAAFTKELRALVAYDTCAITLARAEHGDSVVVHADGLHATLLREQAFAPGEGIT